MRSFDNWISYLNNDGNLLHGKIRFCKQGTTDNVVIYNSDETPIRNPEFTDMLGRTEYQVFVDSDANVTAYFYQYIGTGDMMQWPDEDYDPTRWAYQYSSDNLDPVSVLDITSDNVPGVATMSGLRAVDPATVPAVGGVKMIWLYGYYNAGDKSPVLYVWDEDDRTNDDGGAVIASTAVPGVGRWHLATRELHFDVRHFGIFATNDKYSTDYSYTSQLSNCANYINNEGCDAWFPDIYNQAAYYLFDGTNTFSISGDIYCGNTVKFVCKTGTSGTAISCHELHKKTSGLFDGSVQTGAATLTADNINVSWIEGLAVGDARVSWTVDTTNWARTITGKKVIFNAPGHSGLSLNNCQVESHKAITNGITMENMAIKTEWFADNYNWNNLSLYNCTVKLQDCKDADTYIRLKNKLGQVDYGDLGEQTVTNAQFGNNCIVENCGGSATFAGNAELHNVTLTASFTGSTPNINCVDCWLTIQGSPTFSLVSLSRGTLGGSGGINVLSTLKADNVVLDNSVNLLGATLLLDACVINGAISHIGDPIQENVRGCIFNNSISIRGGGSNVVVNAVWQDNVGFVAAPIIIDRTNLDPDDTHHTYTYENNTGNFPRKDHIVLRPTILTNLSGISYGSIANSFGVVSYSSGMTNDGVTDTSKYLCQFEMFSVGTTNVGRVVVTANPSGYYITASPAHKSILAGAALPSTADGVERTVAEWQSEAQVGYYFPRGLSWYQGYVWRITRLDDFYMSQSIPVTGLPADLTWSFVIDRV